MATTLRARDVAAAIRDTLAGAQTKSQLGKWAFQAFVDEDTGRLSFEEPESDEVEEAIHDLMTMDEGPEFVLNDAELRAMAERLEGLPR